MRGQAAPSLPQHGPGRSTEAGGAQPRTLRGCGARPNPAERGRGGCWALRILRGGGRGVPAAGPRTFLGLAGAAPLLSPGRYRVPPRRMISLEVLPRSPSKCALVPLSHDVRRLALHL